MYYNYICEAPCNMGVGLMQTVKLKIRVINCPLMPDGPFKNDASHIHAYDRIKLY